MEAKTKKYLMIGGIATVVLSGAGYGTYRYFKKKDTTPVVVNKRRKMKKN